MIRTAVPLRAAAALAVTLTVGGLAGVAPAHAGPESDFTARINRERTSRGLRAYAVRSDLVVVARRHAARMASAQRMYHNPRLGSEVSGWRAIAENVGRGNSVASLHSAFMASSSHRGNILSRTYTEVGVGTANGADGRLYVAQVFRQPTGASGGGTVRRPATSPVPRRPARVSRTARPAAPPRVARPVAPKVVPLVDRLAAAQRVAARLPRRGSIQLAVAYVRTMEQLAP